MFADRTYVIAYSIRSGVTGTLSEEVSACFRRANFGDMCMLKRGDIIWRNIDLFPKATTLVATRVTEVKLSDDGSTVTVHTSANPRGTTYGPESSTSPYNIVEEEMEKELRRLYDAHEGVRRLLPAL